jgi:hypothetical protein
MNGYGGNLGNENSSNGISYRRIDPFDVKQETVRIFAAVNLQFELLLPLGLIKPTASVAHKWRLANGRGIARIVSLNEDVLLSVFQVLHRRRVENRMMKKGWVIVIILIADESKEISGDVGELGSCCCG